MEDFATKEHKGIKEKSVYILHLDTPRIIILGSVIIGLLIISVLVGMNISRQERRDSDSFAHDNPLMENFTGDNSEKPNMMDNNFDSALNKENSLKDKINDNSIITADNSLKPKDLLPNTQLNDSYNNSIASNNSVKEPVNDILTHENIETIIPPANVVKKSEQKQPAKKHSATKSNKAKETGKRKSVVEVSKSVNPAIKEKNYFSVQVAAFDRKSKAASEVSTLESKKYNAYVDSAKVNGKMYYKVMVGPVYSKQKAIDLLEEISADKRYETSYIIKR